MYNDYDGENRGFVIILSFLTDDKSICQKKSIVLLYGS